MTVRDISVVIAAYNAAAVIAETVRSVLEQDAPDFELIVVDDGSDDGTASAVEAMPTGAVNTTVIRNQHNQGLTRSLIQGCARASGKYIARIDAGDCYLPGRLAKQYELMERNPGVGLVSCGTRFASAAGEPLYAVTQQPDELAQGLCAVDMDGIRGPTHHGSTMFRRDLYEAVGGYRAAFRVAQDLDLWMRLYEVSKVLAMPEVLYEARLYPDSISIERRSLQVDTARVILEGARCRRNGRAEPDYQSLLAGDRILHGSSTRTNQSRYDYFVGGCLSRHDRESARRYFARAWRGSPLNLKYGARYLFSLVA